ncbi:MAG: long-chain fatty acid--CoA ligase [Geminicoccaceae bacterium]
MGTDRMTPQEWADGLDECIIEPLERVAAARGERVAIDFLGRETSWRELRETVETVARGLAAIGVGKGSRVALMLPNTPFYVAAYYAVTRIGAVVVNLNPLYADEEVRALLRDSEAGHVVTMDLRLTLPKILACRGDGLLERVVVCSMADALPRSAGLMFQLFRRSERVDVPADGLCISWPRLLDIGADAAMPDIRIDPKADLAVLQYTGGTTGLPKGAMLTHSNIVTNAAQVSFWYGPEEDAEDRMLGVLPLFHVFAMTVVMNMAVRLGATMILLPRVKLPQLLRTIARRKPTVFPAVPTLLNAILRHPGVRGQDLASLKFCISGGAALPGEVQEAFEALSGSNVVEGYGLSEASPVISCNPPRDGNRHGSIGLPMPGIGISLRDPEHPRDEVGAGEPGEICVRGPTVMRGYWRRPEETEAAFVDGWLRTGDIGRRDDDGYLHLVDRIKDLILVNGYNVYPRVIEDAIHAHPAVQEVTVIGVPDPDDGEVPKAFVRLREDAVLDARELRDFLASRLSRLEMPREIEFRDELPKSLIGKLSKKELVAEEEQRRKEGIIA